MEVRSDRTPDAAALPAALAVVAESGDDAAKWLRARIQARPSSVILEARERAAHAGLELALEQDVADHARVARDCVEGEEADPGEVGTMGVTVGAPEELVPAADREQRGASGNGLAHAVGLCNEVKRDERLLAVLAAADVEKVVLARMERLSDGNGAHLELVPAPRRAPRQHCDVAAVRVDVQVVRVQMPDDDLHAARSQ